MLVRTSLTLKLGETKLFDLRNGDPFIEWTNIVEWGMKIATGYWYNDIRERSFDSQDEWTHLKVWALCLVNDKRERRNNHWKFQSSQTTCFQTNHYTSLKTID